MRHFPLLAINEMNAGRTISAWLDYCEISSVGQVLTCLSDRIFTLFGEGYFRFLP